MKAKLWYLKPTKRQKFNFLSVFNLKYLNIFNIVKASVTAVIGNNVLETHHNIIHAKRLPTESKDHFSKVFIYEPIAWSHQIF